MKLKPTENPRKIYRFIALLVVGLLACSIATFGWLNNQEQKLLARREKVLELTGNIEADEVMLSFKVPGKIASFTVNEGDEVKEGQVIAHLETDELKVKVAQAQAALDAAKAQLLKAQNAVGLQSGITSSQVQEAAAAVKQAEADLGIRFATWERIQGLYDNGAISAQDKDKAEADYKAAQGRLDYARAALDKARSSQLQVNLSQDDVAAAQAQVALAQAKYNESMVFLNNATLKAPLAGIVTSRTMEPGENVGAGTPVIRITDLKSTWAKVYVSETKVGRIQLGTKAKITTPSYAGKEFNGVVKWINPAGEFATQKAVNDQYDTDIRSFEVKISIPNPDMRLKTGMTATVSFQAGD